MKVDNILIRFDLGRLESTFLGKSALKVIQKFHHESITSSMLIKLIKSIHNDADILRTKKLRDEIINTMNERQINELANELNVSKNGDLYDNVTKIKFYKNSKQEKILFNFFETALSNFDSNTNVDFDKHINPERKLYKFQRQIAMDAFPFLNNKPHSVLLHMPTGSGKTRTAMRIISQILNQHEPALIIWLAYNEELCEQALEEFRNTWKYVGNRNLPIFKYYGNNKLDIRGSLNNLKDGIMIASLGKIYNAATTDPGVLPLLSDYSKLIIIDEAHQSVAETYNFVLEQLYAKNEEVMLLGLSATPGRTWNDRHADKKLSSFFYNNKISLSKSLGNPINYLIKNRYLAKPNFIPIEYHEGEKLSKTELKKIEKNLDIPPEIMDKLASDIKRNVLIIHHIEELIKQGHQRVIFFASTVQHAQDITIMLLAKKRTAMCITSKTSHEKRKRYIDEYRNHDVMPKILCNYGVLTTDFSPHQPFDYIAPKIL